MTSPSRFLPRRVLLVSLLVLLIPMCTGTADAAPTPRIIDGSNASDGAFPYQVLVKIDGAFACGGAILDSTHVVTAAHCAVDFDSGDYPFILSPSRYGVLYGGVNSDNAGGTNMTTATVSRVAVDRRYQRRLGGDEYDSAILTTSIMSSPNAAPIPLAGTADFTGITNGIATGWGDTDPAADSPSDILKQATLPLQSDPTCSNHYGTDAYVSAAMLCAGSFRGAGDPPVKDTCYGDSGGPLAIDVGGSPPGTLRLAGITSFGDEVCGNSPGVYTQVTESGTTSFLNAKPSNAPPVPSGSPSISGTLRVGRQVTCNPPGGGTPAGYLWYLTSGGDVSQFATGHTVTLPQSSTGKRVLCDVRLENAAGFDYAETAIDDAVGPVAGNGGGSTPDTTRPTTRIRGVRCRRHRCKVTIKAADQGGVVKKVAAVVSGRRRACRACRSHRIKTKALKLHKKRGGIYVARFRLNRGRYAVRARSRDGSGNRSRRVKKKFRVR